MDQEKNCRDLANRERPAIVPTGQDRDQNPRRSFREAYARIARNRLSLARRDALTERVADFAKEHVRRKSDTHECPLYTQDPRGKHDRPGEPIAAYNESAIAQAQACSAVLDATLCDSLRIVREFRWANRRFGGGVVASAGSAVGGDMMSGRYWRSLSFPALPGAQMRARADYTGTFCVLPEFPLRPCDPHRSPAPWPRVPKVP